MFRSFSLAALASLSLACSLFAENSANLNPVGAAARSKDASSVSKANPNTPAGSVGASQPILPGGAARDSVRSGSLSISVSSDTDTGKQIKSEAVLPKIEVDNSNIRELPRPEKPISASKKEIIVSSPTPADSLAAVLAEPNSKTIKVWRPAFTAQGFRSLRLNAFTISCDGSVLAFAEKTGEATGPNGTRIILLNTHNWEVLRIFTTDRILQNMAFMSSPGVLAAAAAPQSVLNQEAGAVFFDLKSGNELRFVKFPQDKDVSYRVCATDSYAFFGSEAKRGILAVPLKPDQLAGETFLILKTMAPAATMEITPDGNTLAAASQKAVEYFKLSDLKRLSFTILDLGWVPASIRFLGSHADFILCPEPSDDTSPIIFHSGIKNPLDGRSAGYAMTSRDGKQLFVGYKVKGRIDVLDPATTEVQDSILLEQLRPATSGDPVFVFYLDDIKAFGVIDTLGTCVVAGRIGTEKRWRKRIIWNGGGKP